MHKSLFLFLIMFFVACKNPCRQKKIEVPCNGCDTMTYIKYFPDCKNSFNYTDSTFDKKHLWHIGKIENKKRNGEWIWFDANGRKEEVVFYENGKEIKTIEYKNNFAWESTFINDSLEYLKIITNNNVIIEEGHLRIGGRIGEWILFDTLTQQKIIANYIPAHIIEGATELEDQNNPGTFTSAIEITRELLDGKWKRYNKDGVLLETKTYRRGIETKK